MSIPVCITLTYDIQILSKWKPENFWKLLLFILKAPISIFILLQELLSEWPLILCSYVAANSI